MRGAHLPLFLNMRVNCWRHLSLFLVNHLFKLEFSSTCQGMLHNIEYWKTIQSNCKYITIKFSCCHSSNLFIYCFCYHLWICTPIALPWSVGPSLRKITTIFNIFSAVGAINTVLEKRKLYCQVGYVWWFHRHRLYIMALCTLKTNWTGAVDIS